jgi:hypothetical protein
MTDDQHFADNNYITSTTTTCWHTGRKDLVEKADGLFLPGTLYDDPGNLFRIGFGQNTQFFMKLCINRTT